MVEARRQKLPTNYYAIICVQKLADLQRNGTLHSGAFKRPSAATTMLIMLCGGYKNLKLKTHLYTR